MEVNIPFVSQGFRSSVLHVTVFSGIVLRMELDNSLIRLSYAASGSGAL